MDVQFALESYYRDYVYRGEDHAGVVIRCALIQDYTGHSNGRGQGTAHFRFATGKPTKPIEIALRERGNRWFIPQDANLQSLPCKAIKAAAPLAGPPTS